MRSTRIVVEPFSVLLMVFSLKNLRSGTGLFESRLTLTLNPGLKVNRSINFFCICVSLRMF